MTRPPAQQRATLADRLAHPAPMAPVEVATVGHQVATALDPVHRAGRSHRAVSPSTIEVAVAGGRVTASLCTPTEPPVTERYLAPEQRSGRPVGPAADVYALGVVLLDGLTGRRTEPPAVPADVGSAWRYLLTGMIAASPADRPTAATVVHALAQVPGVVPPPPARPDAAAAAATPRSKLLPGGAHVRPVPVDLPKEHRFAKLLPPVPGLRRAPREPDLRPED